MQILLLHAEDEIQGSWSRDHWDLIVDLGRAPKSFYEEWGGKLDCPFFSIFDLAVEVEDMRAWRGLMGLGLGRVVDRFNIDWWEIIGPLLQREMQDIRLAQRLADKVRTCEKLTVTRPSVIAEALRLQLGCPLKVLQTGLERRFARSVGRYGRAVANLSFHQLRQVVYDKYDSRYVWRRKATGTPARSSEPVVLLPSAYANVTRTAFRYAKVLPGQKFLLVLARETGAVSPLPDNVQAASLAAFATGQSDRDELRQLEGGWDRLEKSLRGNPEFQLITQLGVLRDGKRRVRWGVAIRDAWNSVFERRSVIGCLSADDTNPYSRIPLLLARQRNTPAVACHHGALDGLMAYKNPSFSTYLVKGEMEYDYLQRVCGVDAGRLRIGAPSPLPQNHSQWNDEAPWIVFFTEPYEMDLWRVEAIYREVLPRLCAAARRAGKTVVVKLHPFETARRREQMLKRVLTKEDRRLVRVSTVPMSQQILQKTWCAITVESTTAFECAVAGIPAFLCGWLRHAYLGYAQQYARYGVARMLERPDDLLQIPEMLKGAIPAPDVAGRLVRAILPEQLEEILCNPRASALR